MISQDVQFNPHNTLYGVKQNIVTTHFPDIEHACDDGLLAIGGDLSKTRLLQAYQHGIFPWFNHGSPILWWAPHQRCVLYPKNIYISRSLKKRLRNNLYQITFNQCFAEVLQACATAPRRGSSGTWLTEEMQAAYLGLFECGYAHSIECWYQHKLVGGLYGLALGKIFFGESMFSYKSDSSKMALLALAKCLLKHKFILIDCQIPSKHLISMGAQLISSQRFRNILDQSCNLDKTIWDCDEILI